jgi:hypothetical protein
LPRLPRGSLKLQLKANPVQEDGSLDEAVADGIKRALGAALNLAKGESIRNVSFELQSVAADVDSDAGGGASGDDEFACLTKETWSARARRALVSGAAVR